MAQGAKKTKKRRSDPLLLVVIAALVVFLGVELVQVGQRLNEATAQQAALERQLQQQTQENQALQSDLAKKDDEEFIKDLAREQLGLAEAGERIFYDVND
jgi:cell division protein FtsL